MNEKSDYDIRTCYYYDDNWCHLLSDLLFKKIRDPIFTKSSLSMSWYYGTFSCHGRVATHHKRRWWWWVEEQSSFSPEWKWSSKASGLIKTLGKMCQFGTQMGLVRNWNSFITNGLQICQWPYTKDVGWSMCGKIFLNLILIIRTLERDCCVQLGWWTLTFTDLRTSFTGKGVSDHRDVPLSANHQPNCRHSHVRVDR